jgi:regulatory protein
MAGRITGLRFQKRTTERVNVYVDDQYAFALPAVEAAHLKVGQHIDDAEIARLKALDLTAKAYDRALRFLSVRPRSVAEVRRNLEEAGYDEEAIVATLGRLSEHGYLNDVDFAQFWVENRQRFRPKGPQALRQELRQRGVDRETIDESLVGLDQSEAAYQAGQARAQRLAGLAAADPVTFRRKLGEFLMRRGFDYAVVEEVVQRLLREATG